MLTARKKAESYFYTQKRPVSTLMDNTRQTVSNDGNKAPQHLYIFDVYAKINIGDWYYHLTMKTAEYGVHKCTERTAIIFETEKLEYAKVIASTDTLLRLPKPSGTFVHKYISMYNNVIPLDSIMVEYETKYKHRTGIKPYPDHNCTGTIQIPKVSVKDNTITIKKIKDSWTREEVKALIEKFDYDTTCVDMNEKRVNNWIEENL